jgi:serine/threonine-protein kinase
MAPEQIDRRPSNPQLDRQIDMYQLGVLTFQLLTGRVPFEADTDAAIMAKHCVTAPPRPSDLRPDLPPAIDAPVLAALAKSPSHRPSTARELVEGLSSAFQREPSARKLRILVADDDVSQLSAERSLLRGAFGEAAEIVTADNGGEALRFAESGEWDVIILDLHMPVLSGLEVAAIIRDKKLVERAQVVMVTALGGAADWRVLQQLGVRSMLLKPLDADLFIQTVARLAERARRR